MPLARRRLAPAAPVAVKPIALAALPAPAVTAAGKTRILGIDPGSIVTGYGVIDSDGLHNVHVASGPLRVVAADWPQRLKLIFEGISAVIDDYRPQAVAVEKAFMKRNADSALKLGQARGAAIAAAATRGLTVAEYTPRHIKQAVAGRGGAAKAQVQAMVGVLLGIRRELQADEADALSIALCHGHIAATLARMRPAARPAPHRRKRR